MGLAVAVGKEAVGAVMGGVLVGVAAAVSTTKGTKGLGGTVTRGRLAATVVVLVPWLACVPGLGASVHKKGRGNVSRGLAVVAGISVGVGG